MADQDSRKRLGRGLAALIGDADAEETQGEAPAVRPDRMAGIEQLHPNRNNPRREFDAEELAALAQSISRHGLVQPILVRPSKNGPSPFEIIAGERRWRAAQQAKLHEVPIVIREADDREALELAIIENIQRSDLNAIEEASGYQKLIDDHQYSQNELGQTLGKSRSHVANTLRLLKLPDDVRKLIVSGALSAGHARTLVTASDPGGLARQIVEKGLSVRQAEALHNSQQKSKSANKSSKADGKTADILALESELESSLGLKVSIRHKANGGGTIQVEYRDIDQLDGFCRRVQAR